MPPSDRQARLLTTRYQTRTAAIGERTARDLSRLWLDVGYDFAAVDEFATRAAVLTAPPKATTVRLASAFYGFLMDARPAAVNPAAILVPERWREPSIAFWRSINSGNPYADAIESGAARAQAVARDLIVSAGRRTGDHIARENDYSTRWRRELDGNACAWCQGLTDHTWSTAEEADFGHDRCGCTPVPA